MFDISDLDLPVYGGKAIGKIANLVDEDTGEVDVQATYYALQNGYIDADKFGGRWRSTPRRILKSGSASEAA
jgi:hypothetical protein